MFFKLFFIAALKLIIKGYKYFISPYLAPSCCYEPTCSVYMHQCISTFGILKGIYLGTKRILRCHPWHSLKTFYDPIPLTASPSSNKI